ncbi:MAG: hypothetical protein KC731_42485, partial [Myxococcales bacterium]|nr:hypothetical protein [Myxococcales bacterium]
MTAADPVSVVPPPEERNQATEDDLAVAVVLNIHRLTKGATLYDADNQAAIRQLEMTRRAVIAYGKATGVNPKLFFTDKSVFVGGRLLRAGRSVYTVALELGRIMRRFGVDEVAIGYDVPVEDLRMFQDAVRRSLRGGATEADSPAKQPYKRIRLRRGQPPGRRNEDLSPEDMIIRTYATATIVMRRFLEQLQAQKYRMPIGVRRVAQQLAELSAVQNPAFLGTTALYNSKHEHAGRAVNSALLALAMARQLVDDKRLLARVASGALLFDIGVPRVAGMGPLGEGRVGAALPRLIDEQVPEVPASAAATSWASGGFGDASTQHTVLVYEATSIAFPDLAPAPYDGLRAPTIHARIVATARRFCNLLADPDHERSPDQVVSTLLREARNEADRTMVRLLMSALGIITSGSLVKLSSGETAQVVRVSDNPMMFSTPVVKPVLDASGARIARREFIDLAREDGPGAIYITQLVHLGDDSAVEDAPPRPVEEEVPGAQAMPQHQGLGHQQDWGQQQSWSQQDWGQQQAASSEPAGTGEQLAGGVYDLSGYDLDDGGVHGIVDEETNDLGDLGGAPTAHVSRFHAQASQPPHHGAPPGYPAQPSHPAQPSYAPGGAARAHAQQAHFTPHPSSEPSYPSQPSYHAHSGRPSQPSYPSQSYPSQPSYPSEASYPSRPSQPSHPAVSLTPAAGLPRGTFPPHSYDGANSQAPPSGPNASGNWSMPPNDPDEDDVPSMVLQAIVDGRQQPSASDDDPATAFMSPERKNELASLFFGRKDGAGVPQRAAPARAANDKATVPHTRRGSSFMDEARAAAISQGTPLPGHGPSPAEIAQARGAVEGPTSSRRRRLPTREWLRNKLTGVRPTSQGSLQKTPLVHLLVYMLDRNLTGTTMLVAEGMKTQFIYFDQGVPAKVRTTGGISPLDRVLLELGLVEEAPLLEALTSISRTGDLMGQHLVAGGHLDEPTLLAALQWQLVRKLEYMLDLPTTTRFAYYDGINMLDDFGGPELTAVDPLMMIMSGIRRLSGTAVIRKTTSRLGNTPLRVRREAEPARLMLRPEERGIIDLLRARPLTLGELLERDDLAPRTVAEHTIYAMIVTRYLKLGERQKEPVGRQTKAIPLLHQQVQSRRTGSQHLDSRGGDDGMPRRGTSSRRAGGLFQGGGAGAAALPRR